MWPKSIIASLSLASFAAAAAPDSATFQLDPRLKIELFAAEPDVIDPVALTFDEAGRMYVVEMRDYPYGTGPQRKPGGTIRLLEDTDHDGKADRSTIFADGLSFPTSIAPWEGGVFVTAPPDILYLKDTDGDRVADVREVYFTAFVLGVTDSNVNGLRWGPDNRIHGVNGGNGGTIQPRKGPRQPLELGSADFSFDPRTGEISTTYETSAGYGLVFDEFGRSFSTYNINHIQQRIIPLRYLTRFNGMLSIEPTASISDHGDMARIYPISTAQTRPNHPEQAGHFSSAGGMGFIGFDAYPDDLYRSVVVGDVVGNLLHRDILHTNGPVFVARRAPSEQQREFLASRDPACRMTSLELGPDGALYLTDMQREVIEHPDYIPDKMRVRLNIRAGEDRGRIYRVTPREGLPARRFDLSNASAEQLIGYLQNRNLWVRQTAQRLLVQQAQTIYAHKIADIARHHAWAPARVQALWTLAGLKRLELITLSQGLNDNDAGVRENAVQLLEGFSGNTATQPMLQRLVADPSPRVRFQLALSLGEFSSPETHRALVRLLLAYHDSYWIRMAVYCSLRSAVDAFTEILPKLPKNPLESQVAMLRELAELSITREHQPVGRLTELLTVLEKTGDPAAEAVIDGLERGVARRGLPPQRIPTIPALTRLSERSDSLFIAAWSLSKRLRLPETPRQKQSLAQAIQTAIDPTTPRDKRIAAIQLLRFGTFALVRDALFAQFIGTRDSQTQQAAFQVLRNFRESGVGERLVERWPEISPELRPSVLNFLLSRRSFHSALLTGIETGALKLGELNLDLEQRRALLRRGTPDIQARAARLISDEEYANRKAVVDEWLGKLPADGDPHKGRAVFEKVCAQCHRAGGLGHEVGPDLTSISHRSVEDILFNILDPNMAINPKYAAVQVETADGESVTGILAGESSDSITLLQAAGIRAVLPRSAIKTLKTSSTSLMPEGLEAGFTPSDLRDLIAFLQEPPAP